MLGADQGDVSDLLLYMIQVKAEKFCKRACRNVIFWSPATGTVKYLVS